MIPTLILAGLVFGRWWRTVLAVTTVAWPLLLLVEGIMDLEWGLLGAAGLALINTAVGMGVHQAVLQMVRRLRTPDDAGMATPA
ncbi:MAG: hypothetical protein R3320_11345 [Nitriliruptorales bacterium]|nr:hypothetical protein [Nitriliruptorales bacterium]